MMINKDMKSAVVRPSKENMNRMSLYSGHRMKLIHNLQAQVDREQEKNNVSCIYTSDKTTLKSLQNIRMMMSKIRDGNLLPEPSTEAILRNPFTNKQANPKQREDPLNLL